MAPTPHPLPDPIVSASGLIRRFGAVQALDGLSLQVLPGQMVGLVGPDGAGKTTLMRILAGMTGPSEGEARVLGMDPMSNAPALRNALGYMPQQYSLYGDLTVEENLRFFASMFCLERDRYRERRERLLQITRLEPFTQRRADALSGGMYKKLALACVLLPRPRLLLLDEPTNGVDPVSRRELWALLFELVAEGMAILVTTPYMDEASRCHRVGLIHRGRLLLEGTPTQLLADFRSAVFEVKGGERDRCEALLRDHPAVLSSSPAGARLRLVVRPEPAAQEGLRRSLAEIGADIQAVAPDFEDLFLSAMVEA
jgi:ABC-2 type transport system ATP-binding protein